MEQIKLDRWTLEALLPGMRFLLEMMKQGIEDVAIRAMADHVENQTPVKPRRGRPTSVKEALDVLKNGKPAAAARAVRAPSGYWDKMTPAERSSEMKRRQAVAAAKKNKPVSHPRDPRHPGHRAWLKKIATAKARKKALPLVRTESAA